MILLKSTTYIRSNLSLGVINELLLVDLPSVVLDFRVLKEKRSFICFDLPSVDHKIGASCSATISVFQAGPSILFLLIEVLKDEL